MKRFLKIFSLLVVSLVLLASSVDATLDCLGHSPAQNSFIWYNEAGVPVLAYDGDLALTQKLPRPVHPASPFFIHRS